ACLSAAASIQETLSWLGEGTVERQDAVARTPPETGGAEAVQTVARSLAGTFDCAVVAMRYAVDDEFAMVLAGALDDGLFRQRQSLPRAIQRALTIAMHDSGCSAGALSLITPALFGAKAAELKLIPPTRLAGRFTVKETGLAYFPSEPEHFVGRVT